MNIPQCTFGFPAQTPGLASFEDVVLSKFIPYSYHIFGGKSKRNLRLLSYGVNALLTPRTKTGITSWLKETGLETIDCLRGGLRLYFTTLLSTSKQKISQ